ncbi:Potassium channel AKT1 [Platanthera zijinensis]|uniref:Potassium channel AKT1 n=1 Tax=Platanthera zijinensis TaxID=2320716 RepID=A0AAP0C220_9ASPA
MPTAERLGEVSEMKAEYSPPKEDVFLQDEAPTDFYTLVRGTVVSMKSNQISTGNEENYKKIDKSKIMIIVIDIINGQTKRGRIVSYYPLKRTIDLCDDWWIERLQASSFFT